MKNFRRLVRFYPAVLMLIFLLVLAYTRSGYYQVTQDEMVKLIKDSYPKSEFDPSLLSVSFTFTIDDGPGVPNPPENGEYYFFNPRNTANVAFMLVEDPEALREKLTTALPSSIDSDFVPIKQYRTEEFYRNVFALFLVSLVVLWIIAILHLFTLRFKDPEMRWFWLLGLMLFSLILAPAFPFAARKQVESY